MMATSTTWTSRKSSDIRLVKLFDEYEDIEISSIVQGRYEYAYKVVRVEGAKVTLEKMWEYVRRLRQKHPDRRFTIRRVVLRVNGRRRVFHVITRVVRGDPVGELDGSVPDLIPIYVSLRKQEFYVPERCVRENRKLTNFVVLRVLGALGVARNKYLGIRHII
jgi:hypothetical protein